MSYLAWLVPIALGMGLAGLAAFLWSIRSGQYDDPDGAAERVLIAEDADAPLRQEAWKDQAIAARPAGKTERAFRDGVRFASNDERTTK